LAWAQGDTERAIALAETSLEAWRQLEDRAREAQSLKMLAILGHTLGDWPRATALYEEVLAALRETNDDHGVANVLVNLGGAAAFCGDLGRAASLLDEGVALARRAGAMVDVAMGRFFQAGIARARGDLPQAAALCQESLVLYRQHGARRYTAEALRRLVGVCALAGDGARAARLAGAESALREELGTPIDPPEEARQYERDVDLARSLLGEPAFAAETAMGRSLPLAEAVDEALAPVPRLTNGTPTSVSGSATPHGLSPRETEVLRLVATGHSDREIADILFISHRTVNGHIGHIFVKLNVHTRAQAAVEAMRLGIVQLGPSHGQSTNAAPLGGTPTPRNR